MIGEKRIGKFGYGLSDGEYAQDDMSIDQPTLGPGRSTAPYQSTSDVSTCRFGGLHRMDHNAPYTRYYCAI